MPPQPKSDGKRPDTHSLAAQLDTCDSPKAVSHLLASHLNQTLHLPPIHHWTVNCELLCFFHGITSISFVGYLMIRKKKNKRRRNDES